MTVDALLFFCCHWQLRFLSEYTCLLCVCCCCLCVCFVYVYVGVFLFVFCVGFLLFVSCLFVVLLLGVGR